jgi:hypothetical protein
MAGTVARRLVPAVIVVPLLLGWLHLVTEHYKLFESDFGTAVLSIGAILFFTTVTNVTIGQLSRLEQLNKRAEREQTRLEALRADVSEALQESLAIRELLQRVAVRNVSNITYGFHSGRQQPLLRARRAARTGALCARLLLGRGRVDGGGQERGRREEQDQGLCHGFTPLKKCGMRNAKCGIQNAKHEKPNIKAGGRMRASRARPPRLISPPSGRRT